MKTVFVPYAKKTRQLKGLSRKIRRWIADGTFLTFSRSKQKALIGKLKKLFQMVTSGKSLASRKLAYSMAIAGGLSVTTPVSSQNFLYPVNNPFGLTSGYSFPTLADLDNDGDLDIIALQYSNGQESMVYLENQGIPGTPLYGNAQINPFGLEAFETVTTFEFADIDDDGDLDLFAGDYYGVGLYFKRNNGTPETPTFGDFETNPFGFQPTGELTLPVFADMDSDGDQDIVTCDYSGQLNFYQNIGTPASATFTTPEANPFSLQPGTNILLFDFADLDNDGDQDLLESDIYGGPTGLIKYQENQGTPSVPSFAPPVSWPFNIELPKTEAYLTIVFGDMDSDGDQDFISGGYESTIKYFENTGAANTPPLSADAEIVILQDQAYYFSVSDFPFSDPDAGQGLNAIHILNLPLNGTLKFNGVAINIGQFITADNIGGFSFTPDPGEFGENYAAFLFRVYDGIDYSVENYSMIVDVTEVVGTENTEFSQLSVYPNPAQDHLRISGSWATNDGIISLFDMQGSLVLRTNLATNNNNFNQLLYIGELPSGIYQWSIQDEEKAVSGKIVKL